MVSGSYIIKALCITLAVLPCLFTVSCNSGKVDEPKDNPVISESSVTAVPDTDIRSSGVRDGNYGGRVYKDKLFVESEDGKLYINVGVWLDKDKYEGLGSIEELTVYYTDEEIKGLKVGEEFVFDDDIHFKIESLEETDWEYIYNDKRFPSVPNGKIQLNKDFYLVHGFYDTDENSNIIDDTQAKKWRLTTDKMIMHGHDLRPAGKPQLFELSDDCVFYLTVWNDGPRTISRDEIEKRVFKKDDSIYSKYASCSFTVRKNKVVKVDFYYEEF